MTVHAVPWTYTRSTLTHLSIYTYQLNVKFAVNLMKMAVTEKRRLTFACPQR